MLQQNKEPNPMSRNDAAKILREIAETGEHGGAPSSDPYETGRALFRIMSNNGAPDSYNLNNIIKGLREHTDLSDEAIGMLDKLAKQLEKDSDRIREKLSDYKKNPPPEEGKPSAGNF